MTTRPTGVLRTAVVALAAAAVLAACGDAGAGSTSSGALADTTPLSEVEAVADALTHEGPSTAVLADRSVEPVAKHPKQELPAAVISYDRAGEKKVTVEDTDRVLALDVSGTLAATVWGLGMGDTLVGRDVSTTFPGTQDLPVVTSNGHSLNAETVLSVKPTLVVTDGSIGPRDVVEQLRDAGVTVVFVQHESSFDGAEQLARDVGEVLGVPQVGEELAQRTADEIADVRAEVDRLASSMGDEKLSMVFLYLRGSAGVYYLFGDESGAGDLIEGLGGEDVGGELGWRESQPLTDEAIVSANPDLILVMTHGIESVGGVDQLLQDKPSLALTKAGKHRRFVDMADGDVLSFGPRSAAVLDALARAVYAPA